MGSLPPTVLAVVACALVCVVATGLVGLVAVRSVRARNRRQDAELTRARAEVDDLHDRLDRLGDEVAQSRREAEDQRRHDLEQREYVITSLAVTGNVPDELPVPRMPAGQVLEDQLVATLARQQVRSPLRARAVDAAVHAVAVGHGVRRALRPEVLDRAAAESHVARRRSRRVRKQEQREARRLVRAVRAHRAAETPGRHAA